MRHQTTSCHSPRIAAEDVQAAAGVQKGALLLGAVAGVALGLLLPGPWEGLLGLARSALLGALLLAAADSDLRTGRIPNRLTAAAALCAGVLLVLTPDVTIAQAVTGAAAAGALLLAVRTAGSLFWARPGMGMGDVKLAAVLGLLLGAEVLWALYLAIVAGGVFAALLVLVGRARREVVFAPFIAAGTFAALHLLPFSWVWREVLLL